MTTKPIKQLAQDVYKIQKYQQKSSVEKLSFYLQIFTFIIKANLGCYGAQITDRQGNFFVRAYAGNICVKFQIFQPQG